MNVEIYISEVRKDSMPVYFEESDTFLVKREKVRVIADILKHRWRFVTNEKDWEIILSTSSKLNEASGSYR